MKLVLRTRRAPVPIDSSRDALDKIPGFNKSVSMCADAAGVQDKTVVADLSYDDKAAVDSATWSRIKSGLASPCWDTLDALMDAMGNELPLLWMLHRRGWDPKSLRRYETDVERENRMLREEVAQLKSEKEVITRFVREARAA